MFKSITKARREESGSGEVIAVLFMIPLALMLIFSLIDISIYFQARASVQNTTRDATRQVAIWGGNNSPLNPSSTAISSSSRAVLWQNGRCTPSSCKRAPVVSCTPTRTSRAGQEVSCSTTYYYKSVAPGLNLFSRVLNKSFTIKETARSETGS